MPFKGSYLQLKIPNFKIYILLWKNNHNSGKEMKFKKLHAYKIGIAVFF